MRLNGQLVTPAEFFEFSEMRIEQVRRYHLSAALCERECMRSPTGSDVQHSLTGKGKAPFLDDLRVEMTAVETTHPPG
jgi:hypothetical protein